MIKSYEKYKDSNDIWLGNIPEHWSISSLKHFVEIISGYAFKSEDYSEDDGVPIIRIGDISNSVDIFNAKKATPKNLSELDRFIIKRGDLLLAMTGATIGKNCMYDTDEISYVNQRVGLLRGKESLNQHFLKFYIDTPLFREFIALTCSGSAQENISASQVGSLQFPLPSLEEQAQIAKYLNHQTAIINQLIKQKEKLIELLKEKRQAVINETVTKGLNPNAKMKDSGIEWLGEIPEHWNVVKLKFIGDAFIGMTYTPDDVVDEDEGGTLVLRSSNIQSGKVSFLDNVYIKSHIPDKLRTQKGDILLCSRNGSRELIGKNIQIDNLTEGVTFGAFMTVFRSEYNSFLYYFFNSQIFKALSSLFLSSTINQLTLSVLNGFQIAIPDDEEERESICKYLNEQQNKYNRLIEGISQQIEKLKECRQSIISEAVTGKIDVRDWQPDKQNVA